MGILGENCIIMQFLGKGKEEKGEVYSTQRRRVRREKMEKDEHYAT
jgi:hypothetical protein